MAKADGVLHDKERESLEGSLAGVDLPDLDLAKLLAEDCNVGETLIEVKGAEARDRAFASAYALAFTDGECSGEERMLLDRMRETWNIDAEHEAFLERTFAGHTDDAVAQSRPPVPAFEGFEREQKIKSEIRKTAIITTVLGAFPVPILAIATDLAVCGLEVALAKDIAKFWGKELETSEAKGLLASFGVGTAARIAMTNVLKMFPGWGSAAGAAAAYASTFAVGSVVNSYFEKGANASPSDLKAEFRKAKKAGKTAFQADKDAIDAKVATEQARIKALQTKLKSGELTQSEFEQQLAAI